MSLMKSYNFFIFLLCMCVSPPDTKLNEIDKFEHKSPYDNTDGYNTWTTHDKKGEQNKGKLCTCFCH